MNRDEALALHLAQGGEPVGEEVCRIKAGVFPDDALEVMLDAAEKALGQGMSLFGGHDGWMVLYYREPGAAPPPPGQTSTLTSSDGGRSGTHLS